MAGNEELSLNENFLMDKLSTIMGCLKECEISTSSFSSTTQMPNLEASLIQNYFNQIQILYSNIYIDIASALSACNEINVYSNLIDKFPTFSKAFSGVMTDYDPYGFSSRQDLYVENLIGAPYLLQKDERWGNDILGGRRVGEYACGFTSLAAILSGLKKTNISVDEIIKIMSIEKNADTDGDGIPNYVMSANPRNGLDMSSLSREGFKSYFGVNTHMEELDPENLQAQIDAGKPMIMLVKGHYVSLIPGKNKFVDENGVEHRTSVLFDSYYTNNTKEYEGIPHGIVKGKERSGFIMAYSIENNGEPAKFPTNEIPNKVPPAINKGEVLNFVSQKQGEIAPKVDPNAETLNKNNTSTQSTQTSTQSTQTNKPSTQPNKPSTQPNKPSTQPNIPSTQTNPPSIQPNNDANNSNGIGNNRPSGGGGYYPSGGGGNRPSGGGKPHIPGPAPMPTLKPETQYQGIENPLDIQITDSIVNSYDMKAIVNQFETKHLFLENGMYQGKNTFELLQLIQDSMTGKYGTTTQELKANLGIYYDMVVNQILVNKFKGITDPSDVKIFKMK